MHGAQQYRCDQKRDELGSNVLPAFMCVFFAD